MNYIRITEENIDREHICCAMSGKQSEKKKAWMKERFSEGLVFYRSEDRGKCFIEYIPAEKGFVIYYTDQCPFTYYWVPRVVEAAAEHGIEIRTVHITDKETAQNTPAPVTTYALFRDGEFVTQAVQSDKKFLALAAKEP